MGMWSRNWLGCGEILTLPQRQMDCQKIRWFWFTSETMDLDHPKGDQEGSLDCFASGKGSTWEGGQREPSIAWWHRRSLQASVEMNLVLRKVFIDCHYFWLWKQKFPTDRIVDGVGSPWKSKPTFWSRNPRMTASIILEHESILFFASRQGKWKLLIPYTIANPDETYFDDPLPLLFELDTDPSKKYNLAARQPELVKAAASKFDCCL